MGLTGGIGSGKSTVANIFQAFGVKVFNADVEAKKILNTHLKVREEVTSLLGDVYKKEQADTQKIATLVFNNPSLLQQLNAIIHPRVNNKFKEWVNLYSEEQILIKEAAILIESGTHQQLDVIVLVVAPEELRIQRVLMRDKTQIEAVENRMKSQWSDDEKIKYSNYSIKNNEQELLIPQVEKILWELSK